MSSITKHNLALDIPEVACIDILRIIDMSVYSNNIPTDCLKLEVLLPGFSIPVEFLDTDTPNPLEINFDNRYSGIELGIQASQSAELVPLPDGIYTIQYSVSPNDIIFVKYYHLRTTSLVNDYFKELCKLQLDKCEPVAEQTQRLNDLRYIKSLIDAAKAKVEYCHSRNQGQDMYNYAVKLLGKYKTGCCITCC